MFWRKFSMASLDGPPINWSKLARLAPRAIVLYILAILVLRLFLSRFMEIDEAQFVGEVAFAWNYGNSHPPMYNWLVRLALELTGWNWVLAVALVRLSLLGLYHWLSFDTARRLGGDRAGVLALTASAFLPQIVWMSIQTTAHTILVISASIGIVHAFALLREGKGTRAYIWFGIWAAIGALAKYNFFIFLVSFLIAAVMTPTIRRQLFQRRIWISIAIFIAAFTPVIVASLNAPLAATAGRMHKLAQAIGYLESFDLPRVGIDGLASLLISTFLWAGPALIIFWIGRSSRSSTPPAGWRRGCPQAPASHDTDRPWRLRRIGFHCRLPFRRRALYGPDPGTDCDPFGALFAAGTRRAQCARHLRRHVRPCPAGSRNDCAVRHPSIQFSLRRRSRRDSRTESHACEDRVQPSG